MSNDFCLRVVELLNMTVETEWRSIEARNPNLKFAWIRQIAKGGITEPGCSKLIALYLELTAEPFVIQRKEA
jgi:hypothetical protein